MKNRTRGGIGEATCLRYKSVIYCPSIGQKKQVANYTANFAKRVSKRVDESITSLPSQAALPAKAGSPFLSNSPSFGSEAELARLKKLVEDQEKDILKKDQEISNLKETIAALRTAQEEASSQQQVAHNVLGQL
ncbi:hypothetical protein D9611_013901 [Ephemerocybe angulata]|uniref:Uncharacterized protein n=1 Tax=Ephemerocybe angulata TaxID=980116 RepID=A0A8H5B8U6_9AGAR|nr:hypothetical protein D9611_013901 [Tulosesus angulatus]